VIVIVIAAAAAANAAGVEVSLRLVTLSVSLSAAELLGLNIVAVQFPILGLRACVCVYCCGWAEHRIYCLLECRL